MLSRLIIKNIALIENAEIDFSSKLNVLSGETGSGKSVIIDSLNFVLGAKADKTMIRFGQTECMVQAVFVLPKNHSAFDVLKEYDIESEDDLIVTRKYNINGKGYIKVNGINITAGMLKNISSHIVDVHGQSEHFFLLNESNQLICLDKFCQGLDEIKSRLSLNTKDYKSTVNLLNSISMNDDERERKCDILKYQIDEINNADITADEEQKLLKKQKILLSREKIINSLSQTYNLLSMENGGIDIIGLSVKELEKISDIDEEYSQLYNRLDTERIEIEDVSDSIKNLLDSFDFDEEDAFKTTQRIDQIKNIKKKYGNTIEDINAFLEKADNEYQSLINSNELSENYKKHIEKLKKVIYDDCIELNRLRRESAKTFSENVKSELKELGMKNADFQIEFKDFDISMVNKAGENGLDSISFMFSANLGEPLKTMSKVISGGEMSRFMLALKTQTLKFNDITTFIFDEIDAGISGIIATKVAEKFARISLKTQIIAISHLPQISAMSDNQILIEKHENEVKTVTLVKNLSSEQKISEIIRLLGGNESNAVIMHAKDLIGTCEKYKKNLSAV